MRLLLDTNVLLWWLGDQPTLPAEAAALIGDRSNEVFASAISLWEIAIKVGVGKLPADVEETRSAILRSEFTPLPFTFRHAAAVAALPKHHRDPFDRALVAQALSEPLRLLTHDRALAAYGDIVLLV